MRIIDALIGELEQEAKTTARVLERVPEAHLTWKPHPKSFSLGQLALHVATVPGNVAALAARDTSAVAGLRAAGAASTARAGAGAGRQRRQGARAPRRFRRRGDDRDLAAVDGGRELMAMPRVAFVRAVMLNHWYHHRGQLLVYLRLLDVPLPSVYGPTADENPFADSHGEQRAITATIAPRRASRSSRRSSWPSRFDPLCAHRRTRNPTHPAVLIAGTRALDSRFAKSIILAQRLGAVFPIRRR